MITNHWLSSNQLTTLIDSTRQHENTSWSFFGYKQFKNEEVELLGKEGTQKKVISNYADLHNKKLETSKWTKGIIGGKGEIYTNIIPSPELNASCNISHVVSYKINLPNIGNNMMLEFGFEKAKLYFNLLIPILNCTVWSNESMKSIYAAHIIPPEKLEKNKAFNINLTKPLDLTNNKAQDYYALIEFVLKKIEANNNIISN